VIEYGAISSTHSIISSVISNLSFFSHKKFKILDTVSKVGMGIA
jgi:hypothetical protein